MTHTNKIRRDRVRPLIVVVAIAAAIGGYSAVTTAIRAVDEHRSRAATALAWGLDRKASDRVEQILDREMKPLVGSPLFEKHMGEQVAKHERAGKAVDMHAFARDVGRDLVARGLARLPDAELLAIQALRSKMALASERACPCFWDGSGCSQPDVMDGVSRFNEADLTAWARLSAAAGLLELKATGPLRSMQEELSRGLDAVLKRVPSEHRPRLDAVIQAPDPTVPPSKADQCFAILALFKAAEGLPDTERAAFIRALVAPGDAAP